MRSDVSAVLFDEPLTVIDPQLKWELRRKLKEIHREFKLTLIYVTHDQTEALTFADQVMVMARGRAVQGGADDLFERPAHTFVGHFIGSPGMNFLPAHGPTARCASAPASWMGWTPPRPRAWRTPARSSWACGPSTCGGWSAPGGLPVRVERLQDVGTYLLRRTSKAMPCAPPEQPGARAGRDGLAVGAQYAYPFLPRRG